MLSTGWTPRTVPYGADQTIYLVVDRFGRHGSVYRETEVEQTDLETIITDLMTGQFNDPVRVVAFNTLEHWSDDVSGEIAAEIQIRCDIDGVAVPEHIQDFVASHTGPTRQWPCGWFDSAVSPAKAASGWHQGRIPGLHRTGLGDVNR